MLDEIGGFRFREMSDCIRELYQWYKAHADQYRRGPIDV